MWYDLKQIVLLGHTAAAAAEHTDRHVYMQLHSYIPAQSLLITVFSADAADAAAYADSTQTAAVAIATGVQTAATAAQTAAGASVAAVVFL